MRQRIARFRRILSVANRHGLGELLEPLQLGRAPRALANLLLRGRDSSRPRGQRLREALQELGPVFVKFGQLLSARPDLVPDDIIQELILLQDQVAPFPAAQARQIIESETGSPIEQNFSRFEDEAMASASVAQVHAATLHDGSDVVVKLIRPGIEDDIERDVDLMYTLARLVEKYWPEGRRLRLVDIVRDYDHTINDELDLQREAGNASQMRSNFCDSDLIYVPEVNFDLTSRRMFVMERIYGIPIREVDKLRAAGIDMKALAEDGVEIFFKQAFRDGFFHADMHAGNIFVAENGQYCAVDFGIMGTLGDADKKYLAENFLAFFNRDYHAVAQAHLRAGWVPAKTRVEDFEAAIRTVCEPIFAKPISEISFGRFVMRLFQTARRFEMPVQPQLVLLQKTLFQIEGLGRQLYPQLDLWDTAKPYLESWMKDQIGPQAAIAGLQREAPRWASMLPEMPRLAYGAIQKATEQGPEGFATRADLDRHARNNSERSRRSAAAVVAAGLLVGFAIQASSPEATGALGWLMLIAAIALAIWSMRRS